MRARRSRASFGALLTPASLAIIVTVFPESERGAAIGSLDGLGRHRLPRRPAARRPARRPGLVALGVLPQPPARADHARARAPVRARRARAATSRGGGSTSTGALLCALRARGHLVRPDRAAAARLVGPGRRRAARRRASLLFARVPALRAAHAGADAAARACSAGATSRVANVETFLMYGGMALQGFFLILFLQQVAGFSATEAGAANLVPTRMMFLLSRRFGRLADRYGPRWFMTVGPCLVAAGFLLMLRLDADATLVRRPAARAARLLARAGGHGRAAHRDRARRRRRARRRDRLGGQQRDRAHRRPARDRGGRRGARDVLRGPARRRARRAARSRPRRRPRSPRARDRALAPGRPVGAAGGGARGRSTEAVQDAGVATFHLAAMIGAGMLVAAGPARRRPAAQPAPPDGGRAAAPAASSSARPRRSRWPARTPASAAA